MGDVEHPIAGVHSIVRIERVTILEEDLHTTWYDTLDPGNCRNEEFKCEILEQKKKTKLILYSEFRSVACEYSVRHNEKFMACPGHRL